MLHANRIKVRTADKRGRSWCPVCDRRALGDLGKCRVCGTYRNRKKIKLDPICEDLDILNLR